MTKASIYTRKGDAGETGMLGGVRLSKTDPRIEAVGTLDELNSHLGVIIQSRKASKQESKLVEIQKDLFAIGSVIAGYTGKDLKLEEKVLVMEEEIDDMWGQMPELANFILPNNELFLARAVARRAERSVVQLATSHQSLEPILKYLNRLSDYLFCLARWVNFKKGAKETVWK
ncbi:MAG: cob(I)yrinic acid a,c-diamide adenosyltransferase [Patescibacteria group bacterium]|nr:cob(I)yrinic acid a,c-diamide adenosyltransferase [Patescibacteria group bacterium]